MPPQWNVVGPFGSFFTTTFGIPPGSEQLNTILFFVYAGTFLAIVFASYAGRTLDFRGKELRAPEGTMLSLLIGLLNGYLVAGTIWYYAALFGYPVHERRGNLLFDCVLYADVSTAGSGDEPGGMDGAGCIADFITGAWMMSGNVL